MGKGFFFNNAGFSNNGKEADCRRCNGAKGNGDTVYLWAAVEMFISERANPDHYHAYPILSFTERDVWNYTFKYSLPIYLKYKGYRSIDGIKDKEKFSEKPACERDLENTGSEWEGLRTRRT
ncbi:MAG: phosphoadenosine phosphosulfate reductase family protein [Nitrososphaeria archaeon]